MKYGVTVSYTESGYVEVEANSPEEAEEKTYDAIDNGELELYNQWDEPNYKFEIEELDAIDENT